MMRFRVHRDPPLTTYVLNLCHDIFPKSTSYFLLLFVFVYYNKIHPFDQHSHTRKCLTPLAILFTVCRGGGVKGCSKRCGLDFRIPKVQWV